MTTRQTTKAGATRHTCDHGGAFGRRDPNCHRCQELTQVAPARTPGWVVGARRNVEQEASRSRWIKQHNCRAAGCGSVCTAFGW